MNETTPTTSQPLSRRQCDVVALVAKGHTRKEAAHHLGISESTVKNHLILVYRRLDLDPGLSPSIQLAVLVATDHLDLQTGELRPAA